jgi:chemotaxis signal transduction protein
MSSTSNTPAADLDSTKFAKHMTSVARYRQSLEHLQSTWDNLSLLGQLSGTSTDVSDTRRDFFALTGDVLTSLGEETLKKTIVNLTNKAQVSVDILIRNLFERTADIGFLATDYDIRSFLMQYRDGEPIDGLAHALRNRFEEYVHKYSVYFNILLLDTQGNVLVQLDHSNPVTVSQDSLIHDSLISKDAFVETFRHSDLLPNEKVSLIYSYRVTEAEGSRALGVLCLAFKFNDELEKIFNDLVAPNEWTVLALLDAKHYVIASSDPYQIPIGAKLHGDSQKDWSMSRFAGREYLSVTHTSKGYQGYMGPGWRGHAMIPIEHAFDDDILETVGKTDPNMLNKVMRSPLLFSQALLSIPKRAAGIQSNLNRSVWNGNIRQRRLSDTQEINVGFSKTLLWEISNTGLKTQDMIEQSVRNLYQTAVSVILQNARFSAALAVDIMDRNLYERANDCRWWSLISSFRERLSKPQLADEDRRSIGSILNYINRLYTVYDTLLVYNREGDVIAVSNAAHQSLIGKRLNASWIQGTRALKSAQEYVVSSFEPSPLYRNKPTYIYAAAIHAPNTSNIVGGIAAVFDSEPQFLAMLEDALPRNDHGQPLPGSFTLFVDSGLRVISSTNAKFPIGSTFNLKADLCKLESGQESFDIVLYNDQYYAVGARASSGYREYKGKNDSYKNTVIGLIFIALGNAQQIDNQIKEEGLQAGNRFSARTDNTNRDGEEAKEYATFYTGHQWVGLPAHYVVEAMQTHSIKFMPGMRGAMAGLMPYGPGVVPILDLGRLFGDASFSPSNHQSAQVIILQSDQPGKYFGILVSALGEIPDVPLRCIESMADIMPGKDLPLEGIAKMNPGQRGSGLLMLLSIERLYGLLGRGGAKV